MAPIFVSPVQARDMTACATTLYVIHQKNVFIGMTSTHGYKDTIRNFSYTIMQNVVVDIYFAKTHVSLSLNHANYTSSSCRASWWLSFSASQ